MPKSIRISDDLYSMARLEAAMMHRSVAQQIEHWAAIGQVLELRGDLPEVRELSIAHMRLADHDRVRTGKAKATDYHVFPADWFRNAKLIWPKDAFKEYEPKDHEAASSDSARRPRRVAGGSKRSRRSSTKRSS